VSSDMITPRTLSTATKGTHNTCSAEVVSAAASENTAQCSQIASCTNSSRISMSGGAKSFLLQVQGGQGSSLAFCWSKIAAREAGITSQISSSNSRCKASTLRVELIIFAILKNALRSRASRPTHESSVGRPERSRDIVFNPEPIA
jgi:hypothetical protein